MKTDKVYYLFSSITFLQFFIPLVIESKKRGYKNIFIIRPNLKDYANPLSETNSKILETYIKQYEIEYILFVNGKYIDPKNGNNEIDLFKISGIVFMVDGDIYGPPRKQAVEDSNLFKLNKKNTLKISMTEHMNFWAVYEYFINDDSK